MMVTDNTTHVVPDGDLIEHDTDPSCICGPTLELRQGADLTYRWAYVHHRLGPEE